MHDRMSSPIGTGKGSSKPKHLVRGNANKAPYLVLVEAAVAKHKATNPFLDHGEAVRAAASEVATQVDLPIDFLQRLYNEKHPLDAFGSRSVGHYSSSSQAGHLPPLPQFAFPMAQQNMQQHVQMQQNSSVNASYVMPGSVQNSFSQNMMTSQFQQGYPGQYPPSVSFPPSFGTKASPSVPAGAAQRFSPSDHSLGGLSLLGDACLLPAASDGDQSMVSPKWKGLIKEKPKETKFGKFDTKEWPLMKRFITLVNSHFFEVAIDNAKCGERRASTIGGAVREAELFSHPDTLIAMYGKSGDSLRDVPISIADIVEKKWKPGLKAKKWSHSDSQYLFLEFSKRWMERYPEWEIISMLLLYGNGRMDSDQDIHIDIGRAGGQFIYSVADHEVACTVTYEDKDQCVGRGSLYLSFDFLKEWGVKDGDIETLKETMSDFFEEVDLGKAEDSWRLLDSDHGSLLHDFGTRENSGSLDVGEYCFQEGPVPHRAPEVKASNFNQSKCQSLKSTGVARPVIFGVVRRRNTDYTYDYNDQKTPPQLVGQIIETLFPRLQLRSDFKSVDEYKNSAHYSAKKSLLFVYAKTIFRSNDFSTEKGRMFQDNGYTLAKDLFEMLLDSSNNNLKSQSDVFKFNRQISGDLLKKMMEKCDDWSSNQKTSVMDTD